jgi:hypothetical protein
MINSVRNTVFSVLNKNNYGYITPDDFNLYAKQAQLDIFDDYFYDYNYQINKENARASGTGYADIRKGYEEVIDGLSETKTLTQDAANSYFLPSQLTTGDDYYLLNKLLCFNGATFLGEAERVSHDKATYLTNSMLTSPTEMFPAYIQNGSAITVFPDTINGATQVKAQYIRYPKDPKWTYVSLTNGEPLFNASQPDYQDFELAIDDQVDLVIKILQYAGMSIREVQAVQFAKAEEQFNNQEEK